MSIMLQDSERSDSGAKNTLVRSDSFICHIDDPVNPTRYYVILIILMITHTIQPILFYYAQNNPKILEKNENRKYLSNGIELGEKYCISFMFFWDIVIVGAWFAPGPIHCLPYLTSYIKCDFIISFLSLGNLLIENTQEEWKEKLIGRYILSK